jgi:sterol desaturase/sphingolipid hydroxylase (fatty acid hydroxylase superfamily)
MRYPNTPQNTTRSEADEESTTSIQRVRQLRCVGTATVEAVAFWAAVVLPLPTLFVMSRGVGTQTELLVVSTLLILNLLAFYVGHDYSRPDSVQSTDY